MIILRSERLFSEDKKKKKVKSSRGIGRAMLWTAPTSFTSLPAALIGRKAGMKRAEKIENEYEAEKKGTRRGALVGGLGGAVTGVGLAAIPVASVAITKKGGKLKIDKKELMSELKEGPVKILGPGLGAGLGIAGAIGGGRGARAAISDDRFRRAYEKDK